MFLPTLGGNYVNLDHVVRAVPGKDRDGDDIVALLDANGKKLGDYYGVFIDFERAVARVIPSSCLQVAVIVRFHDDIDAEPFWETRAIVGWRIDDSDAIPVLAGEDVWDMGYVLITSPDGRLYWGDTVFDGISQALPRLREAEGYSRKREQELRAALLAGGDSAA